MTTQAPLPDEELTRSGRPIGWVPFVLITLVLLPALFGSLRLIGLAGPATAMGS